MFDTVVLPAAAYVELALAAGVELLGTHALLVENLAIRKPLLFAGDEARRVQLIASPADDEFAFEIFSRVADDGTSADAWTLHAAGRVLARRTDGQNTTTADWQRDGRAQEVRVEDQYRRFEDKGIHYGPSFRALERIASGDGEVFGEIRLPDTLVADWGAYHLHPVLLDACFQALDALGDPGVTYLPVGIGRLELFTNPGTEVRVHGRLRSAERTDRRTVRFGCRNPDARWPPRGFD